LTEGFRAAAPKPRDMDNPVDLRQATEMPVLARIVVPLTAVQKEAIGEVRGMSREFCQVPLPPDARVVQAERTEGAWVVWYVEKIEAI
jgi:hypothetical protein